MRDATRAELGEYIRSLHDDLIECYETKDFTILDLECGMMARMIEHVETTYVIAQLRTLFAHRDVLPAWERLAQAAKVDFERRGLSRDVLVGLVTYEPS